jgi:hypothetical protein
MSRQISRDEDDIRDMTLGKKNYRRFLTDIERAKEADNKLKSAPSGRYLTLEEWEEFLGEDS